MNVSTAGAWSVHAGTVVTPEGATKVIVISDGHTEFHSPEDPTHLVVALMNHFGMRSIEAVDDDEPA